MRLIDADELVKICRKGWRLFGFSDEKICHWVDEYDINAQPTIKAIPIEWILNHPKFPHKNEDRKKCILDMIEDWEKENETD
jgi:hypothetical protein